MAINSDSGQEEPGLFAGVADWPHIDEIFAARSLSILAAGGIPAWRGAGGRPGYDGRLSFGAVSSPALEIFQELTETGGFLWADDVGVTWAVRFAHNGDHDLHSAFAVIFRGCVGAIDSRRRRPAIRRLKTQVARCSQPARSWDDADRAKYGSLTRALYSLRLVDGAEQILGHLQHHAGNDGAGHVLLSVEELISLVKPAAEETWRAPTVNELAAMLGAAMRFEIARLRLGSLGWNPRVICQSAAITDVELIGGAAFRIRISPWFGEVAAAFARAVSLRNTRRAQRRIARLAASPAIRIGQDHCVAAGR
jgi:hypothetical protein